MSEIQILSRTATPSPSLLDDLLNRKPSVTFSVPDNVPLDNGDQAFRQFYTLLWREAEREPLKLAKILCCTRAPRIRWGPRIHTVTVEPQYSQQASFDCQSLDFIALCPTENDIREYLRDAMLLRKQNILLLHPYTGHEFPPDTNYPQQVEELRKKGAYNDQRYLERHIKSYRKVNLQINMGFLMCYCSVEYRTTYEQEQILYNAVDAVIEQMKLRDAAVFDKIRLVYSYMVRNIRYDHNYQRYTAYHAMIEHCACCQGYALLFYLFMRKLGVPVEYIRGVTSNGEHHGWNLVKFGACWYNIDTTWEHLHEGKDISIVKQNYLLKSDEDFQNHIPNDCYKTEAFRSAHPMAKKSI